jgi:hypothetical protein
MGLPEVRPEDLGLGYTGRMARWRAERSESKRKPDECLNSKKSKVHFCDQILPGDVADAGKSTKGSRKHVAHKVSHQHAHPIERLLQALPGVQKTGANSWKARCPNHDDRVPSLSVKKADNGKILVRCLAGCDTSAVLAKIGLRFSDLFPQWAHDQSEEPLATYDYCDADGNLVHQTVRYANKKFRQRRPDGNGGWIWNLRGIKLQLYHYPELLGADASEPVYYVEGEKDADKLCALGFVATCNPMGAGKWSSVADDAAKTLNGRHDVVIADKDDPGRQHAQVVAQSLQAHAASVKVIELPGDDVKDASDWIAAGGTADELRAIVDSAPLWEPSDEAAEKCARPRGKETQAQKIVELFNADASAELFHDGESYAYATFAVDGHRETWSTDSRVFLRHLRWLFYKALGKAPNATALTEAQATLEAQAMFDGECEEVHTRIAGDGVDTIYIDLCDKKWRVVEISGITGTYRILTDPPVRFIRKRGMKALPKPRHGGSLTLLRRLLNIGNDANWALLLGWLVAAMRPIGPYPVLVLHGEHGTSKSTLLQILRRLIDPNKADLRAEPRDTRDLAIAAINAWIIAMDNISYLPPSLSDAVCRLSTGGGFATRELFTNDQQSIFDGQRPVMLDGIEEVATRGDLLDRSISIELETITEDKRKRLSELWADFDASAGKILGALCKAAAHALRTHRKVKLDRLPRMADFAVWATAAERGLGLPDGAFMAAYDANRAAANDVALESSPVASLIVAMVRAKGRWSGTATDLLDELTERADEQVRRAKWWPRTPRGVSGAVRRMAPNLRGAGIEVDFDRATGRERQRQISITMANPPAKPASSDGFKKKDTNRPNQPSEKSPYDYAPSDDSDDSDDVVSDYE